jgi:diacylglycerol kinase (ATP)
MKENTNFFIVNPAAGAGQVGRLWPVWEEYLRAAGLSVEYIFTREAGQAPSLAEKAIKEGYRRIIAVGGDGSGHEVVNGIMQQKHIPSSEIEYGLLPLGTGNDWVKTYKISRRKQDWVKMLRSGSTQVQDVGRITYQYEGRQEKRYFVNVVGLAYDAFVVHELVKRGGQMTRLRYLGMVLECLWKYHLQEADVWVDGKHYTNKYYTINIGNARYSGGGMRLVPHALPEDGLFAVTLAGPLTKMGVLTNLHRLYNGKIGTHPKIEVLKGKKLLIKGKGEPLLVEADGEFLGETPVEMEVVEGALKVIVAAEFIRQAERK